MNPPKPLDCPKPRDWHADLARFQEARPLSAVVMEIQAEAAALRQRIAKAEYGRGG